REKTGERRTGGQSIALKQCHERTPKWLEVLVKLLQGAFSTDGVTEKNGEKIDDLVVPEAPSREAHLFADFSSRRHIFMPVVQVTPRCASRGYGLVERLDVQDAVILTPVLTAYPADAEVGTIQLQEESGPDDGVVFLLHRLSQGGEIHFVRRIILVLQEQRDDARRSGGQKGLCYLHAY